MPYWYNSKKATSTWYDPVCLVLTSLILAGIDSTTENTVKEWQPHGGSSSDWLRIKLKGTERKAKSHLMYLNRITKKVQKQDPILALRG